MNVYAHSHSYMRSSPLVLATWLFASLETSSIAVLTLHRPTSCSSIATQDMLVLEELQWDITTCVPKGVFLWGFEPSTLEEQ